MPLQEADLLIRKRAEQSEIAANYVKAVDEDGFSSLGYNNSNGTAHPPQNGDSFSRFHNATFHNGVGFDNGNGLWSGEQGFAIGGQERLSRMNGYLSELAAAAFVCRVSTLLFFSNMESPNFASSFCLNRYLLSPYHRNK